MDMKHESASGLGVLIFVAILLHKAPAAIGFGTFLQHEGLEKWSLSKHLLVCSYEFLLIIGVHTILPSNSSVKFRWTLTLGSGY